MKKVFLLLATILVFFFVSAQNKNDIEKYTSKKSQYGFIENKGQIYDQNFKANVDVKYLLSSGNGNNVQLKKNSFCYDTYKTVVKERENKTLIPKRNVEKKITYYFHRVDVELIGANENPTIIAEEPSADYLNYYNSVTPESGSTNIRSYKRITYKDIYPGIDMAFSSQDDKEKPVEYNFIIHPGADASQIQIHYIGANETKLSSNKIKIEVAQGELTENIPASFIKETNTKIDVSYVNIGKDIYGFEIPSYNSSQTLIIDPNPNLDWATYYGGSETDYGKGIACDDHQNVYITGCTNSINAIATSGAYQTIVNSEDAFIIKFDNNGVRQWGTYYGGSGTDYGYGITCDNDSGNVLIVGFTDSNNGIATTGAQQPINGGANDAFVVKLNSNGIRQWGTFYGGSNSDYGVGIACDDNGNVFITGRTTSSDSIATSGSHQSTFGGGWDAFIVKFNLNGVRQWSTYYGGSGDEFGNAIACDNDGNVFTTGSTTSTSMIASLNAHQITNGGGYDVFVVKFNSSGVRQWATYYGGSGDDEGYGIVCNPANDVLITGVTTSTDSIYYTSPGIVVYQASYGGGVTDAFIAKFKGTTGGIKWGSYYGGTQNEVANGISCDKNGSSNIFIIGTTNSSNAIASNSSYQDALGSSSFNDAFAVRLDGNCVRQWGTYFGGLNSEEGSGIACDDYGNAFITGRTNSYNSIATDTAHQITIGGLDDAFVAKFSTCPLPQNIAGVWPPPPICIPQNNITYSTYIAQATSFIWTLPGGTTSTTSSGSVIVDYSLYTHDTTLYLSVYGSNSCGNSDTVNMTIPLHPTPPTPTITIIGTDPITLTSDAALGNQWWNGNLTLTGATNQTFSFTTNGDIYDIVTINGCSSDTSNHIYITGIGVYEDINGIYIYPNPAKEKLTIDFRNGYALRNTFVSIYDIQGQLLLQTTIIQPQTEVNINSFAKGIYVLKINNNNNTTVAKFVKE